MNNFRPWAPPQKSSKPCPRRTQNHSHPKPSHNSLSSTTPPPKHHLPARPPAEVYVPANADTPPCPPPSSSQSEPRRITSLEPHIYLQVPKHSTISPSNSAPYISELAIISWCDIQGDTGILTEPASFQGDSAEDGLSSPSISSLNDSLEEFLRLPDTQENIPINPVILADLGPWEDVSRQLDAP